MLTRYSRSPDNAEHLAQMVSQKRGEKHIPCLRLIELVLISENFHEFMVGTIGKLLLVES